LLLLSCTTDDVSLSSAANDLGENGDGKLEMVPVRFFGYNIAVDVEEQSARGWKSQLTRAGSDKTAFIENDEIGLFVTNTNTVPDGTLSTSVSAAYNNHYQFNNSNELISTTVTLYISTKSLPRARAIATQQSIPIFPVCRQMEAPFM
jgi:hypothetical protein